MRGAWLDIDLAAIRRNAATLRRRAGRELMAVVKANAYGHGAVPVARAALAGGASWLGVATVGEAAELVAAGIEAPILVLGFTTPEDARQARALGVRVALGGLEWVPAYAEAAPGLTVHIKVDTGMGRFGCRPADAPRLVAAAEAAGLQVEGVFTHFATADADPDYLAEQRRRFADALTGLAAHGHRLPVVHADNSAALLSGCTPGTTLARAGIALYGLAPDGTGPTPAGLVPALTWRAVVARVERLEAGESVGYGRTFVAERPVRVATLPFGYADGFRRSLSNRGVVLVNGRRCRVVGRVSMDQVTVALPDDLPCRPGDPAVVIGRQGDEAVRAEDMAVLLGTINYEVVAGLSPRLPRRHLEDDLG